MTEAEKERIKLAASLFNTLASNAIVVGVIGPFVGALYGITRVAVDGRMLAVMGIAAVLALAFHAVGRSILEGLR